jgi:hypothetical protein
LNASAWHKVYQNPPVLRALGSSSLILQLTEIVLDFKLDYNHDPKNQMD